MSTQLDEMVDLNEQQKSARLAAPIPVAAGIVICLLLAIAQVGIAGYQLGVGNQAIQIAFLKHLIDPTYFASDEMVKNTLPLYPSYFFYMLAPLARMFSIESLYLVLHVLTTFLTLVSVYLLGREIFRSHFSALVGVLILLAGHHQALAGDGLYSTGFTHTYAALPLAIAALALVFSERAGRFLLAFALAGVLFNFHALTGAYTMAMLAFALLADAKRLNVGEQIRRAAMCVVVAVLLASPTLYLMVGHHQAFSNEWMNLMRIRSAEHSFPSTWWNVGNPDLPRFAVFFALFALSWSFPAVGKFMGIDKTRGHRIAMWMTIAVLVIFGVGYFFSEIVPLPLMIRFQPFRASRLLMVLMFVFIGHGVVQGLFAGIRRGLSGIARVMEVLSALLIFGAMAIPSWISLLPLALGVAIIAAICSGRLSWRQALISAAAILVVLLAHLRLEFPLPFLPASTGRFSTDPVIWISLMGAFLLAAFLTNAIRPVVRNCLMVAALVLASILSGILFQREYTAPASDSVAALESVSHWVAGNTPKDAVFLAPSGLSNFRILAERGLVADWRDGTQLYFSGSFADEWFKRLRAIEPGIILSPGELIMPSPIRLIARGRSLDSLDTDSLLALAKTYKADYILLPTPAAEHSRALQVKYADSHYTVYLAAPPVAAPTAITIPKGVIDPKQWTLMEKFMQTTVAQNIDTYRKAAVTIQVVDRAGKPVPALPIILEQKSHAFNFAVSLGFFVPNDIDSLEDQKPNVVTPKELQITPTIFNASMLAFTSKWVFIEPQPGKPDYRDLDKYVDYCTRNHMAMEFHFLSGLPPRWLMGDYQKQGELYPDHVRSLMARYADRIQYWQLTNEERLMPQVAPMFKEMKAKYPDVKLGIADCVKFGSYDDVDPASARADMYKGLQYVPWLRKQGVQLDYFGIHGHRPFGLWADPRVMYEVLDTVAEQKVKIHITEMLLPLNDMIVGPVMRGRWTPENQADFLERYLTVCFSHPACELVNFWGLTATSWGDSAGLLDSKENPRPALLRIKHLINDVWHTHVESPLAEDGTVKTRAFHGGYLLSLTLPDGRTATLELKVPVQPTVNYKVKLDADKGTLEIVEGPGPATDFPVPHTPAAASNKPRSMSGRVIDP